MLDTHRIDVNYTHLEPQQFPHPGARWLHDIHSNLIFHFMQKHMVFYYNLSDCNLHNDGNSLYNNL